LIANGMTVEEAAEIAGVDVELVRGLGLKVIIQDLTPTTAFFPAWLTRE
jgi:hypothetical protein